jgi:hypothetical protein
MIVGKVVASLALTVGRLRREPAEIELEAITYPYVPYSKARRARSYSSWLISPAAKRRRRISRG